MLLTTMPRETKAETICVDPAREELDRILAYLRTEWRRHEYGQRLETVRRMLERGDKRQQIRLAMINLYGTPIRVTERYIARARHQIMFGI